MKHKNVVCLGGAGFIGSHLSNYLSKENNVLVLDNLLSGKKEYLNSKVLFKKFDVRYGTIRLSKLLKDFKTDYVFHLVACPFIPDSYENPEEFVDINIKGTLNVLKACQEAKVKKILVYSSSEVYGGSGGVAINEDFPVYSRSTYATTKLAADRLCYNFFKEHLSPVIILRQFNCYGDNWTQPYVIPEIIQQLTKSNVLRLGNIFARRDFLYVEDSVELFSGLIEKGVCGETYNLGSGQTYSIKEIATLLCKIIRGEEPKFLIEKKRLRPDDVQLLLSDNSKVYKVIKGRPFTSLEEGLQKTYSWFQTQT
jgi:dTDP-glucose 4,6-dehydratase